MKIFIAYNKTCGFEYNYDLLEDKLTFSSHTVVGNPTEADLILFPSTCCCTISKINSTVNYINNILQRKRLSAKTYLTGCITRCIDNINQNHDPEARNYFLALKDYLEKNIDYIVPDGEIDKLIQLMFPSNDEFSSEPLVGFSTGEKHDTLLKNNIHIAKGCLNNCTFCKKNYQSFRLQSADIDYVIKAIDDISDNHKSPQISLVAHNVIQYGLDLYGRYRLLDIINYIETKHSVRQIDLAGFAFKDAIGQNLDKQLSKAGKPLYLISGLESGSDGILKLMKKGYTANEIKAFMETIRKERMVSLSVNIIAGFPTETDEDIKRTIDLLDIINVRDVTLCAYLDSPFIPSHNLPQFHPEEIIDHVKKYERSLKTIEIPYVSYY